ncbi:MAG: hypothetical protein ABI806_06580 [Candidatus Solibacter sp.]
MQQVRLKRLAKVSDVVFEVKFVVFEAVALASFLYVVYQMVSLK